MHIYQEVESFLNIIPAILFGNFAIIYNQSIRMFFMCVCAFFYEHQIFSLHVLHDVAKLLTHEKSYENWLDAYQQRHTKKRLKVCIYVFRKKIRSENSINRHAYACQCISRCFIFIRKKNHQNVKNICFRMLKFTLIFLVLSLIANGMWPEQLLHKLISAEYLIV